MTWFVLVSLGLVSTGLTRFEPLRSSALEAVPSVWKVSTPASVAETELWMWFLTWWQMQVCWIRIVEAKWCSFSQRAAMRQMIQCLSVTTNRLLSFILTEQQGALLLHQSPWGSTNGTKPSRRLCVFFFCPVTGQFDQLTLCHVCINVNRLLNYCFFFIYFCCIFGSVRALGKRQRPWMVKLG